MAQFGHGRRLTWNLYNTIIPTSSQEMLGCYSCGLLYIGKGRKCALAEAQRTTLYNTCTYTDQSE